jgi:HAD superfamily hydrolase (TIGR01509 family)
MKFEAILFDCDGVLVDSELITNGVLRDMLDESGWRMTLVECMSHFVGKAVREERATIEAAHRPAAHRRLDAAVFTLARNQALVAELVVIEGAHAAVQAAHDHTLGRIACASGADRFKVEMQLTKVGLMGFFEGRVFSGHEMPRSKPAPDVYLAAARHLEAEGHQCLVIEDTPVGVTAAWPPEPRSGPIAPARCRGPP